MEILQLSLGRKFPGAFPDILVGFLLIIHPVVNMSIAIPSTDSTLAT
jgi:hypothetical protein